jgi:hypothetical protein
LAVGGRSPLPLLRRRAGRRRAQISSFSGEAILSSEDFESILGTPLRFLPLLKHRWLKDHRLTIVLWVRDQASYLESLYFEMLRHPMAEGGRSILSTRARPGQSSIEEWTFHLDYKTIKAGSRPVAIANGRSALHSTCCRFHRLASAHLDGNLDFAEEETQ